MSWIVLIEWTNKNDKHVENPTPLIEKKDWLVARAMFTNHFSEQFFSRFASLPTGRKSIFWSYMLRLHTGAVCGLWFLLAIGSMGVFGIFTNHAKNMDLLRNWISTETLTCKLYKNRLWNESYPLLTTNMLFPSGQNVGKPFRRWRKSETHSLETMAAIARSPWNPLSMTWYPDVGVPEDGNSSLGHWVKMKQTAFTCCSGGTICYRQN